LNQFADGLRCGGHARFAGPDFGWNADAHMDEGVSVAKILTYVSVCANSRVAGRACASTSSR
jgi:hypothetical protein